MENVYLLMIVALAVLAIADLVVGVSNDAVNFLNSAIGSKAISFKTIMIVASIGVAFGAIFSSGMMEVARKGIFVPGEFMFAEIMIIYLAVMITDILLLDFFNSVGMPTSTTVSIVFELLGASVAMGLIKIGAENGNLSDLYQYIKTAKATQIILGILLSVVIAFSIGAIVQWISRLLLSFDFQKKPDWYGALFGGVTLTAITYFIFIKGIKGTAYASESFDILGGLTIKKFLQTQVVLIVALSSIFWSILSFVIIKFLKQNIYKLIILVGTFALALAFAGNDLVNFIGVPIAAWQAYEAWIVSGIDATEFSMAIMDEKVATPTLYLLGAGLVMVLTLWFSSKAKDVVKTSLDLSSQENTKERFEPNFISRLVVRFAISTGKLMNTIIPNSVFNKIENQFKKPVIELTKDKVHELPAFDMVRAAVNLMVAAVLISIATSLKLPLSTTYVTFMVAMGTSLADKAWGAESAVYRVAGVLNVIGGWFFTAFSAFTAAAIVAYLLHLNVSVMMPILLLLAVLLLARNYVKHKNKNKELKAEDTLKKSESKSLQGVIHESASNIANVVKRGNKIYTNAIKGLAEEDLPVLKKNKKQIDKLSDEIEDLRDNIFYFIKSLDESSVEASNFYINILGDLQDMTQSLEYISKTTYKHVNNNHLPLKESQIKELRTLDDLIEDLFVETKSIFESSSFDKIVSVLEKEEAVFSAINSKIEKQIARTRTEESSPKNTTLYFSLLLESRDLLKATMSLLRAYHKSHNDKIKPAVAQ